jgi:hypothetical protein
MFKFGYLLYTSRIFSLAMFRAVYKAILFVFFLGMIQKAGEDNNRSQKDGTNRKSVVVVDDEAPAQQKSGCC